MDTLDPSIIQFLENQTAATICCVNDQGMPYCFNAFYAFDTNGMKLYFKSQLSKTHHGSIIDKHTHVSGTILPDTLDKVLVKGVQFVGNVHKNDFFDVGAAMHYHTRHPMAMAVPGEMWTIELSYIKYTDNAMGFGHKTIWKKDDFEL